MAQPIRVGIVGASPGSWAAAAHLPALAQLPEFTVTAVATTRPDSARATASVLGTPHAFASADQLAEHPEVDLVVAAVPVPAHAAVIRSALAAGKHVYCEWPLATSVAEAADLTSAAAAAGVVHAAGLQACQSPGARFVADLIADRRIGEVTAVSMTAAGDPLGGSTIPRSLAWSADAAAGNNLLTVMTGHALAALEQVAGPLRDVCADVVNLHDQVAVAETGELVASGAPSQVALHGRLGSGALLSLAVHGGSSATPGGFTIVITGTGGSLTVTPAEPAHYAGWADWRIRLRRSDGTGLELPVPGAYRVAPPSVPAGPAASVAAVYREIARAISQGRPAHPGFDTALALHQTLAAVERSASTGTRQQLAASAVAGSAA